VQCWVSRGSPRSSCAGTRRRRQPRAGWTREDGRADAVQSPSGQHQSPSHSDGHFLASKPAFDLQFVISHHHRDREEAWQVISSQREKKSKKIFLNVAFSQCFEGRVSLESCTCQERGPPHETSLGRKNKTQQTHLANTSGWRADGRTTAAARRRARSSPPALSLWFSLTETNYEGNHLNLALSAKNHIAVIPSKCNLPNW